MAERRYSQLQRDAIVSAYARHGVTGGRVAELAAAGELEDADGKPLDAFTVPKSTVRDLARQAQLATAGKPKPASVFDASGNTVEALRQRLLQVAHEELAHEESKPLGDRDMDRIRQATRCALEASKLPTGADAPPPPDEEGASGSTATGAGVGALIREHRATVPPPTPGAQPAAPAPEPPHESPLDRLRRGVEERTERLLQAQAEREDADAEPAAVDDTARLEARARRGQPQEDTDSIVPGSFARGEPEPKPHEPTPREAMRYGTHLVQRDRLKGHLWCGRPGRRSLYAGGRGSRRWLSSTRFAGGPRAA